MRMDEQGEGIGSGETSRDFLEEREEAGDGAWCLGKLTADFARHGERWRMPVSGVAFEASKHKCGDVEIVREVDEMGEREGF